MEWLGSINRAIEYIEENLLDEISVEDVSARVYSSYSNFSRIFYLVTGITIGEYIRNRRMSLAGRELSLNGTKIIDIALKYHYDTPESFSKAFSRFHGIAPSDAKKQPAALKFFYPLTINISVQGGFSMAHRLIDEFYWRDCAPWREGLTDAEKYQETISWARRARGKNPGVFDALTEWILDDSEWTPERLIENRQILIQGIFARFREQNARLRSCLMELKSSGLVNEAAFAALDRFDMELSGVSRDPQLHDVVSRMFADFSVMADRGVRRLIAGSRTGPTGTDGVDIFGYINCLKDCDAQVQWTLFMPDTVKRQQDGFRVEIFEYRRMPALRFIGLECTDDDAANECVRREVAKKLDALSQYRCGFDYDMLFMHHYGITVDVGPWHGFWGRFMRPDTPVPEGFQYFDLIPENDGGTGAPFISQFAYARFSGDNEKLHLREGFDSDAMYDVTRNIMLAENVCIPYPTKYWTAEVFLEGYERPSAAYLFSAELNN